MNRTLLVALLALVACDFSRPPEPKVWGTYDAVARVEETYTGTITLSAQKRNEERATLTGSGFLRQGGDTYLIPEIEGENEPGEVDLEMHVENLGLWRVQGSVTGEGELVRGDVWRSTGNKGQIRLQKR